MTRKGTDRSSRAARGTGICGVFGTAGFSAENRLGKSREFRWVLVFCTPAGGKESSRARTGRQPQLRLQSLPRSKSVSANGRARLLPSFSGIKACVPSGSAGASPSQNASSIPNSQARSKRGSSRSYSSFEPFKALGGCLMHDSDRSPVPSIWSRLPIDRDRPGRRSGRAALAG